MLNDLTEVTKLADVHFNTLQVRNAQQLLMSDVSIRRDGKWRCKPLKQNMQRKPSLFFAFTFADRRLAN
jgi:hypothetical protein